MLRCCSTPETSIMLPKKSRIISTVVLTIFVLSLTALLVARRSRHVSAAQSPPVTAQPAPALPAGPLVYPAKATTSALFLARQNLTTSSYMTVAEFEDAIRNANGGKATFKKDEKALIPGIEPQPIVEKSRPFPHTEEIRAIYLTTTTAG